ncbi:MAG: hypothetical protein LW834_20425, partial [Cyanobium sp. 49614_E6]|nr:hypothetical protein [Cyanobium sp. 49614_E6]
PRKQAQFDSVGLDQVPRKKLSWLILSAMSGSAQTAHSRPQRITRKPINILAHAQLLGFAVSEGLPAAQRRFPLGRGPKSAGSSQ